MRYIDTSCFVKYYGSEETEKGCSKIVKLVEEAKDGKEVLISNFLIIGETVSVFDRWVRLRLISAEELDGIIKRFFLDVRQLTDAGGLILEPLDSSVIVFCIELVIKHHISINDAVHLYTALSNKGALELFICSDEMLLNAAKAEGLEVFNPEED